MKKDIKKLLKDTQKSIRDLKDQWKTRLENMKKTKTAEKTKEELLQHIPNMTLKRMVIDLSAASIAKATVIVILLYVLAQFVFEIRGILLIFFVALLFSAALDPTVDYLQKKHVPRGISILLIYVLIFTILGIFISNFIPLVATQLIEIANSVGGMINKLTSNGQSDIPFADKLKPLIAQFLEGADRQTLIDGVKTALLKVGEQLQGVAGNAWKALKVIFNGIFNVILVLVVTFFMTLNAEGVDKFIKSLFPKKHTTYIIVKTNAVKNKIGAWLRGQLILSISIGILVTIGLSILRVDYAATLGMIAAITEFIPYIGPIMAAIPSLLIAFNQSPWLALWVLGMYIVVQQLENQILVPIIMKKAVGLSPIFTIFAMLIGAKFLGVVGIILAVPVTTIIWIFLQDYMEKRK